MADDSLEPARGMGRSAESTWERTEAESNELKT